MEVKKNVASPWNLILAYEVSYFMFTKTFTMRIMPCENYNFVLTLASS